MLPPKITPSRSFQLTQSTQRNAMFMRSFFRASDAKKYASKCAANEGKYARNARNAKNAADASETSDTTEEQLKRFTF